MDDVQAITSVMPTQASDLMNVTNLKGDNGTAIVELADGVYDLTSLSTEGLESREASPWYLVDAGDTLSSWMQPPATEESSVDESMEADKESGAGDALEAERDEHRVRTGNHNVINWRRSWLR